MSACGGGGPEAPTPPNTGGAASNGNGGAATDASSSESTSSGTLASCPMFPATAVFNTRIDDTSRFPVHARSTAWVASIISIGPRRLHLDWGNDDNPANLDSYYGIPINIVDGSSATTLWPLARFDIPPARTEPSDTPYVDESDCAAPSGTGGQVIHRGCNTLAVNLRRFPFPLDGHVLSESGNCNDPNVCGDHHVLVVEQGACRLWEGYAAYQQSGQWYVMGTSAWDLNSLALRPKNWTSSDAAGLPITPFLARAAEASSGEVRHALRVTLRDSVLARSFVWPARHAAGGSTPTDGVPFGAVLRLKASFVIPANWSTQAKALATAMKRYGLYVADIGTDFYVQGEPNATWSDTTRTQLQSIDMGQMEFVDMTGITTRTGFNENSMAASW
ncbi:MAG: hypothetical protein EOP38_01320 [Rubrivivax sp.]|nr:MAG: hypothetical protein EOP38_01320 [Rubrivivax sp.]